MKKNFGQKGLIQQDKIKNISQNLEQRQKKYRQDAIKQNLLKELDLLLVQLNNVQDVQFDSKMSVINDKVIEKLYDIEKRAMMAELIEVKRLCVLSIGRRIFNIEIKKRKQQHNEKKHKKQQIENFFRENRIKKQDYASIQREKFQQNTLICRPYSTGKGFIQSESSYPQHYQLLDECNYLAVIKQVNKIYFKNFTGINSSRKITITHIIYILSLVIFAISTILTLGLGLVSFQYQQHCLVILLIALMIGLAFVSISTYIQKPNNNNQLEQTRQQIREFFETTNINNELQGKTFKWNCPEDLMYLEVKFQEDLQKLV